MERDGGRNAGDDDRHHSRHHRWKRHGSDVRIYLQTPEKRSELLHCLPGLYRPHAGDHGDALPRNLLVGRSMDLRAPVLQRVGHV